MYYVFDIGGTKTRMAHSLNGYDLLNLTVIETPKDFESAVPVFQSYFEKHGNGDKNFVCCGLPGVFNTNKDTLLRTGHLPFWINKPIKETLSGISNSHVSLENDASLAALGEAVVGAGKGREIVGYLTFGTGVGGARIVRGKIDRSLQGFEPGHQIIDADGTISGMNNTLDALVGGSGIKKRFSMKAENIKDPHVWGEIEKLIAIGVVNTILHWSPQTMILGGGIMQNEFISVKAIEKTAVDLIKMLPKLPEIKKGILGDESGLRGGLVYLRQMLEVEEDNVNLENDFKL